MAGIDTTKALEAFALLLNDLRKGRSVIVMRQREDRGEFVGPPVVEFSVEPRQAPPAEEA